MELGMFIVKTGNHFCLFFVFSRLQNYYCLQLCELCHIRLHVHWVTVYVDHVLWMFDTYLMEVVEVEWTDNFVFDQNSLLYSA